MRWNALPGLERPELIQQGRLKLAGIAATVASRRLAGSLQAHFKWRSVPWGTAQASEARDVGQSPIGGGRLVDGERVAAASTDRVDPRVIARGVHAVGQPPA
jgi:hypothetical protein